MVFSKSVIPLIEAKLTQFTPAECQIADYFLYQVDHDADEDFSSRAVANRLNLSEASLSRFAQKCGFRGFREFVYAFFQPKPETIDDFTEPVLTSYQELLNKTYALVDVKKIEKVTQFLLNSKNVFIYGKGSSGNVAKEIKFRFMRLGLVCEAITDDDMMRVNEVVINKESLVIGISISGQTKVVIEGLLAAKKQRAKTVLLTANDAACFEKKFDIVVVFAMKSHLEYGKMISPQFPILIMLDILYANFLNTDHQRYHRIWQKTYNALQLNKEKLSNL